MGQNKNQQMAENEVNYGSNMIVANLDKKGPTMDIKYGRSSYGLK
jgi:hypothetical protein